MAFSPRDKRLIYFGSLLAAVTAAYVGIISPLTEDIKSLDAELNRLSDKAQGMMERCSEYDDIKTRYGQSMIEYNRTAVGFCKARDYESLDEMLTGQLLEKWLTPIKLEMKRGDGSEELAPYNFTGAGITDPAGFCSDYIIPVEVTMSFGGSFSGAMEYIDFLNSSDGIFLKNTEFSALRPEDGEQTGTGLVGSMVNVKASFTVYTYDKEGFMGYAYSGAGNVKA